MSYNFNPLQQQIQDLSRQYQTLVNQQPSFQQPVIPQPQQITIPIPPHQVQYVEGMAGARLYQEGMVPNSSEIIMDKDENILYQVSKDANGTPAKRIPRARFVLEDLEEEESVSLTRKDFDDFKEEIRQMIAGQKQITLSSTQKINTSVPATTAKKA